MKDAKLRVQRDETRFTGQVELTTLDVLVLLAAGQIRIGANAYFMGQLGSPTVVT